MTSIESYMSSYMFCVYFYVCPSCIFCKDSSNESNSKNNNNNNGLLQLASDLQFLIPLYHETQIKLANNWPTFLYILQHTAKDSARDEFPVNGMLSLIFDLKNDFAETV